MKRLLFRSADVILLLSLPPLTIYTKKLFYNGNCKFYQYFLIFFKIFLLTFLSLRGLSWGILALLFSIIGKRLCIPAITGGIGAGKTTLGKYLASNGFYVIDSDRIAREFLLSGTVTYKRLIKCFGIKILGPDGEINRAVLREIVYRHDSQRKLLNKCLHKYIIYKIIWEVVKYRILSWKDLIAIEVPLLYETHLSWLCCPIIVCLASQETRLKRCQSRNSEISKDMYINIMKSQTSYDKLLAWADIVIENESTVEDYYESAEGIIQEFSL